ncbi:MAG: sulfite reductase subunit alpha [Verrucomicrobia bacterium]|nr:sulfite reductase subunit alpha [Verrucomicrobiota bacterium]
MQTTDLIPVIPETAPFTAEQRAWLNGFFAGLFSRQPAAPPPAPSGASAAPLLTLTVLFGSQTGNAEGLARKIANDASRRGFAPTVQDMGEYPPENLKTERHLLIVTSTYGDGEPPDNAKALWEFLSSDQATKLPELKFSVLALGDSNYAKFCACGKNFDRRLEELGAHRVHPRVDCDVEFEEPFGEWLTGALGALASHTSPVPAAAHHSPPATHPPAPPAYSRNNPFRATLTVNRLLNGDGSGKETRHFEISLEGSGLRYEAGDSLAVLPTNCPSLVDELLRTLDCDGEEAVLSPGGAELALHNALLHHCDIRRVPAPLLRAVAERAGDAALTALLAPGAERELEKWLHGREIIDLLLGFPAAKFQPKEFVELLKKLQPRLYSISSGPKIHPASVHLTVAVVRYTAHDRARKGACSTFLSDRTTPGTTVPVFVHTNKAFRPPADGERGMIMVGPGTGIAPFRAFLQERRATGAKGGNWLFFGDQRAATDFLYRDELEAMQRDGLLTRLDTAFSRDQAEKIYVQHRMLENAAELFAWLEAGAHFYVCGDAARMAKDVDAALHQVIERAGSMSAEQAAAYVKRLQAAKRYARDVY